MANANKMLSQAKAAKKDEFYTQLTDIERELRHYKAFFEGKVVLCNCDDPFESNFFKYFAMNFNALKLKKLIATCYATSPIIYTQLSMFTGEEKVIGKEPPKKKPYKVIISEVTDLNGDGCIDLADVELLCRKKGNVLTLLKGDGDFKSPECVELLQQADVVVTNPPFSLFREYVAQLMKYNKKFLIIGNQNAIHYKEIFPLLKDDKMWLGYGFPGNVGFFESPYEDTAVSSQHKEGMIRVSGVMWFTNIDIEKRHENLILYRAYSSDMYPTYENFNAIEVGKTSDIPCDYYGNMGVPDTFLQSYNPAQFEIVGLGSGYLGQSIGVKGIPSEHKKMMRGHSAAGDLYLMIDGKPKVPYSRIIIRRRKQEAEQ